MTSHPVINPATEDVVAEIPSYDRNQTEQAIARAVKSLPKWQAVPPAARAELLRSFAAHVRADQENLAQIEVKEAGHTISNARWEAGNVADLLEYSAGAIERHTGQQIPVADGIDITFHEPVGVVGVIVPWNFPMPIASWGFAPALAAGNAVIIKPAELTPLTALRLAELAQTAGIDRDVFQVLTGSGAVVGETLTTYPDVNKIVFTGSTAIGRRIMSQGAATMKRLTLELGGKSANIIFDDADLEQAALSAPGAVFDNAGQDCCARSRILIQRNSVDRFLEIFEKSVKSFRVEDPTLESAQMGPLISAHHKEKVVTYLDNAEIAFTGSRPTGPGYWVAPSVVLPKGTTDPIVRDEVFGPVVSVQTFDTEAEAIALANDSVYGLSGSIWTENIGRALRVARGVQSGALSVNSHSSVRYATPFGGFKLSGLGRELGPDLLDPFTETKNVYISTK